MGHFAKVHAVTEKWEGGKVDHPKDPGGRTAYGVTQRVYNAWRRNQGLPVRDVWLIELRERLAIYENDYWKPVKGDLLPDGLNLSVYDMAVNSGVSRAIKTLQVALNARAKATLRNRPAIIVDGVFGNATLDAVEMEADIDLLVAEYNARRLGFVQGLSTWATFGKGWSNRIAGILKQSQMWATGSVGPAPVAVATIGKAQDADISQPPVSLNKTTGATATTGTVTVIAQTTQQIATTIEPLAMTAEYVKYAFLGLTVLGIVLGAYLAYRKAKAEATENGDNRAEVDEDRVVYETNYKMDNPYDRPLDLNR